MSSYNVCGFIFYFPYQVLVNFSGGSNVKESACNAGDPGLTPGWGRYPGEGNGNPLQWAGEAFSPGESPWTEEPSRLPSMGSQTVRHY